jgi:hypothetical protein
MKSQKRSQASRVNGAKSRGPVTEEGRRKVAFNALRHGLTSKSVVLSNESADRFQELFETYVADFLPEGEIEFGLVEEMVAAKWRIRRIWGMETSVLDVEMDVQEEELTKQFTEMDEGIRLALALNGSLKKASSLTFLSTHENRLSRAHDRALRQLRGLQAARRAAEAEAAAAQAALEKAQPAGSEPETAPPDCPADTPEVFLRNEPEESGTLPQLRGPVRAESPAHPSGDPQIAETRVGPLRFRG